MTRYKLRVTDAPGQPARIYDTDLDDLESAKNEARAMAGKGFIGGCVSVIDSTVDHPDRNIVHTEQRK